MVRLSVETVVFNGRNRFEGACVSLKLSNTSKKILDRGTEF